MPTKKFTHEHNNQKDDITVSYNLPALLTNGASVNISVAINGTPINFPEIIKIGAPCAAIVESIGKLTILIEKDTSINVLVGATRTQGSSDLLALRNAGIIPILFGVLGFFLSSKGSNLSLILNVFPALLMVASGVILLKNRTSYVFYSIGGVAIWGIIKVPSAIVMGQQPMALAAAAISVGTIVAIIRANNKRMRIIQAD